VHVYSGCGGLPDRPQQLRRRPSVQDINANECSVRMHEAVSDGMRETGDRVHVYSLGDTQGDLRVYLIVVCHSILCFGDGRHLGLHGTLEMNKK
jgi:hypothetical protein